MHLVVLYNPIAGAGRAARAAEAIESDLRDAGHHITTVQTRPADEPNAPLESALHNRPACLIVVGGDGTVRMAAEYAVRHDTPIYQFPFGTENLFAREFGMRRDVTQLQRALERNEIVTMDLGHVARVSAADGPPAHTCFLMMTSIGFDADVIADLASRRTGGIRHWSYILPIIRTACRWKPSPLRITVDDQPLETPRPGITIVATAPQYAFRLNPVPHARRDDGLLHLVHMPARAPWQVAAHAVRARLRRHLNNPHVVTASGRAITIEADAPDLHVQADGDLALHRNATSTAPAQGPCRLEFSITPGALCVLVP